MFRRIAATLLCAAAPAALLAQSVVLESSDKFISVEGEIVGYNGTMVRVRTAVGEMAVPASELVCFGDGCLEIIATNDFGLTAASFEAVDSMSAQAAATGPDDLQIAFSSIAFQLAYNIVAGAFPDAALDSAGVVTLQGGSGDETAVLTPVDDLGSADVAVLTVPLGGTGAQPVAAGPIAWATDDAPSHQLMGLQSFSVIVAPNAGINSISMNDLARIYAGEVKNWSEVGGADLSILPLQLPPTSPTGQAMQALIMEPAGKQVAGSVLTMSDEAGVAASINQFPGSISIVSAKSAIDAPPVSVSGACDIAVAATPFNIASGDYPLVRPVMARFNTAAGTTLPTALFDFAASPDAQNALLAIGFDSFSARTQGGAEQNARLSQLLNADLDDAQRAVAGQMFQVLFGAQRLSPTMTGGAASGPEAAWNRAMLQSVVAAISDPANAGKEIVLAGFADSAAGSEGAIAASASAAAEMGTVLTTVAGSFLAENNITLSSYGFGNVSPATCIDGQVAGGDYTRVEVWVR